MYSTLGHHCSDITAPCTEVNRLTVHHFCTGKPKHDPKPAHEHKGGYGHTKPPKIPWVHNPKPVHEHKGHYGKPKHAKGHYGHAKPTKHEHKGHYGELKPLPPQPPEHMHEYQPDIWHERPCT